MSNLEAIVEEIRAVFESKNAARDAALERSRALIRHCANAIRAAHRASWPMPGSCSTRQGRMPAI